MKTLVVFDVDGTLTQTTKLDTELYVEEPDGLPEGSGKRLLDRYDAGRFVVGHTVQPSKRITSRLEGKVFFIDTGMLASHYGGRASALEMRADHFTAVYLDERMAVSESSAGSTSQ